MVLAAYLVDRAALEGVLTGTLEDEIRLTSRLGSLPDNIYFDGHAFVDEEIDVEKIMFMTGEYLMDGLMAINSLMGRSPWFDRSVALAEEAVRRFPVESRWGRLPHRDSETAGNYMRVLPRLYLATGNEEFLDAALRIARAWCLEVMAENHGLPADEWDFEKSRALNTKFRLGDHGNELIEGLAVCYHVARAAGRPEAAEPPDRGHHAARATT